MPPIKAVDTPTLELITSLQNKPYLRGFYLVGGTALTLYLGHRKSNDIDLFCNFNFDAAGLLEQIQQDFSYQLSFAAANTLKGSIGEINVDLIAHRYKLIASTEVLLKVNVISIRDIIAMKLNAISISGQRSKDFIDIFYLLNLYDLGKMLEFYREKYDQQQVGHILKSLVYFNDVDLADWPVLIENPTLKWVEVRKKIEKAVMAFARHA